MKTGIWLLPLFLLSSKVNALPDKVVGHMTPLSQELLNSPIEPSGCPGIKVLEWRPDVGHEEQTGPSERTIAAINGICSKAIVGFPKFLQKERIFIDLSGRMKFSMSLMPFLRERSGFKYRNLNDVDWRFSERTKTYTSDGRLYTILGYTDHSSRFIYLRNDVLTNQNKPNKEFQITFAHELFHAMSYHYGLYHTHHGDQAAKDEELAIKFSNYIVKNYANKNFK